MRVDRYEQGTLGHELNMEKIAGHHRCLRASANEALKNAGVWYHPMELQAQLR